MYMLKLTNKTALEMVLSFEEVKANSELVEKLNAMLVQVSKKNSASSKPSKTQLANQDTKEVILNILGQYNEPKSITELQNENEEINQSKFSNQKLSALLKQLVTEEKVTRIEEKKKAKFLKK